MSSTAVRSAASDARDDTSSAVCHHQHGWMKLAPSLRYEKHRDRIGGLVDSGEFHMQMGQMADELEAVWFRSIGGRWKQLISHYLVHGTVSRLTFELIIYQAVRAAIKVGLKPCVLTCDQASTQWGFLKSAGVSVENPQLIIKVDDGDVCLYVVIDIPHGLKNMRNALRNYNISLYRKTEPVCKPAGWTLLTFTSWTAARCVNCDSCRSSPIVIST